MKPKSLILILIALGFGTVAALGISQVVKGSGKVEAPKQEMGQIIVALGDININDALTAENVKLEEWPKDRIPEGAINDMESLEGTYAAMRMFEGEPILQEKLMDEYGAGAAEQKIPAGYRVMSVKVNATSAVSNLILPGSRVDVMCTFRAGRHVPTTMTRIIMKDVRVFAVNAQTSRETDAKGNAITAKNVSVLVTPSQGEKLLLASASGNLSLTLRNPDEVVDENELATEGATIDELLRNGVEIGEEERSETDDIVRERTPSRKSNSLSDFLTNLDQQPAPTPAAKSAGRTMMVLSANGPPRRFVWQNGQDDAMPREVGVSEDIGAPAIPVALPQARGRGLGQIDRSVDEERGNDADLAGSPDEDLGDEVSQD